MDKKYLLIIVTGLLLTLAIYKVFGQRKSIKELKTLHEVLNKEIQISKNKEGNYIAKIEAYETTSLKDFLDLQHKDSLTASLQNKVKTMKKQLKKQGSISKFSTSTKIDTVFNTIIVPTENNMYPIYKANIDLKGWIYGDVSASKDSVSLFLRVKNDYTVTIGNEPQGFLGLGKSVPFAEVENHNPYTETKSLRAYQVMLPKQKKFSVGPAIGFGLSGQFIGVSLQYGLIRF